jgi:sulfoquinovose isomerase
MTSQLPLPDDVTGPPWFTLASHRRWLAEEADRLVLFAEGSACPDGFGWQDERGAVVAGRHVQLWITTRMIYVFSLATLWGRPGAAPLAAHGLAALRGRLHDNEHGGWFSVISERDVVDDSKKAYEVAFVVLASSAALTAGVPGAQSVLLEALDVLDRNFWSTTDGLSADLCSRDFSVRDPYRGANANMHLTEAYLAAADALDDLELRNRALSIADHLINGHARAHGWRLPEHYDTSWHPLPDYHRD